ncbi:transglutaminase-like domain-containing protein [Tundrisphaera lichenicola]|uniref:transglutaminase-like domain-containing protein n=1 Tax=Tundrisphaera lichenicola TaxID=2029860 RepID=UPI003EBC5F69
MLIRIGFEIAFEVPAPAPMVLALDTRPEWDHAIRRPGGLQVEPRVPIYRYDDSFGNRCIRLIAPPGRFTLWDDAIVEDSGLPDEVAPGAIQHPIQDLPDDVLVYLLPSRYCEVDRLSDIAWELFGQTPEGWARAQAICDWVHGHVTFGYEFARPTKSAYDVFEERKGVCRDFTHLALTLCRCMNIPARYATGYLGDIGVPLSDSPMDFSGWFEVYLGGRWYTMDARHNTPRIGRIVMARGRDAVDVALTTSFGTTQLEKFVVWTDEVGPESLQQPPSVKTS